MVVYLPHDLFYRKYTECYRSDTADFVPAWQEIKVKNKMGKYLYDFLN